MSYQILYGELMEKPVIQLALTRDEIGAIIKALENAGIGVNNVSVHEHLKAFNDISLINAAKSVRKKAKTALIGVKGRVVRRDDEDE